MDEKTRVLVGLGVAAAVNCGGTEFAIISRKDETVLTAEKSKKSGRPWIRAASCGVISLRCVGWT